MKCKIILKDEVNCKVDGLDLQTRRKCEQKLKFFLPYARHVPAYKLGRWDGCVGFFTMGGNTFVNALSHIIPILQESKYDFEVEDNRNKWDLKFNEITEEEVNKAVEDSLEAKGGYEERYYLSWSADTEYISHDHGQGLDD